MSDDKLPTREELQAAVDDVSSAIEQAQYLAGEPYVEQDEFGAAIGLVEVHVGALRAVARAVLALSSEPRHLSIADEEQWREDYRHDGCPPVIAYGLGLHDGKSSTLARLVAPDEGGGG